MKYVKLNSICNFKQWHTIPTKELKDSGYPVYGANGIIGFSDKYNHDEPTIMICCRGATCGAINVSQGRCYINGNAMSMDNLSKEFDIDFVVYYLKYYDFSSIITGAAQPQITQKGLEKVTIPSIPLSEQKKIVKDLNSIDEIIKSKKLTLSSLDEIIKSRFNELFGDPLLNEKRFPLEKLSSACPFNVYKGNVDIIDGKVWLLNLDMIESDTGVILNKLYVDISEVGNSVIRFDNDCVLYSKLRPYLNKVVASYGSGYASSELIYMKTGKRIKKEFLANLLRTKSFVDYIDSKSSGAKMPRANMDFLRNFSLIIPPENLQEQFVTFVNQIDKSKFVVQQQIKDLEELLDKKMDEYFGG